MSCGEGCYCNTNVTGCETGAESSLLRASQVDMVQVRLSLEVCVVGRDTPSAHAMHAQCASNAQRSPAPSSSLPCRAAAPCSAATATHAAPGLHLPARTAAGVGVRVDGLGWGWVVASQK